MQLGKIKFRNKAKLANTDKHAILAQRNNTYRMNDLASDIFKSSCLAKWFAGEGPVLICWNLTS